MLYTKEEEIDIANLVESEFNLEIIKSEYPPFTLYSANEIGKKLNIKDIKSSCRFFNNSEKKKIKRQTIGGEQDILFLTIYGLIKILNKSRKPESINFSKIININLYQHKFSSIECDTLNIITDAFNDENIALQYPVDKYKIDLYFIDYKIAIECDESHHLYNAEEDLIRQNRIIELLNCQFIRYSPLDDNFDILDIINKIFKIIKSKLLEK